jgi:hypothetical protein
MYPMQNPNVRSYIIEWWGHSPRDMWGNSCHVTGIKWNYTHDDGQDVSRWYNHIRLPLHVWFVTHWSLVHGCAYKTHNWAKVTWNKLTRTIRCHLRCLICFVLFWFLVGLGLELEASPLQSRHTTAWTMPPVHFALVILEMGVLQTICFGWPSVVILLISVSQLVRIIGTSPRHPAAS